LDSFFFNITDTSYKITNLFKKSSEHITRVDISNGIVFFDISLKSNFDREFLVKNLDRMVVVSVVKNGGFSIFDNIGQNNFESNKDKINIFCSSRQDLKLTIKKAEVTNIFVLFIADFFLKRYLSAKINEPVDFLYNKIQEEISLELINSQPIDALSLYIIEKILGNKHNNQMSSIICEHSVIEFIIHRLSLLDIASDDITDEEKNISYRAKQFILKDFIDPPTIQNLAHKCGTNESKIKKIFKKVYKTTIYGYIQKLRLEEANLLLKDRLLNIGEISKAVGYKHQGHFSKLFFETFGVYPKDLLKK
jgi:AraC-like DNA-binding protein